jgi:hypothetical protein
MAHAAQVKPVKNNWIEIVQDDDVLETLHHAEPMQRKQLEKAIRMTGTFLNLHYIGNAYSFDPGYVEWSKQTGPLMAMTGEEFDKYIASHPYDQGKSMVENEPEDKMFSSEATARWITCPKVNLVRITIANDQTQLDYQAHRMGYLVYRDAHYPRRFVLAAAPSLERVSVILNSVGLIADISPLIAPYGSTSDSYRIERAGLVRMTKQPLYKFTGIGDPTEIQVEEKAAARQIIRDLDQAAAQFCH